MTTVSSKPKAHLPKRHDPKVQADLRREGKLMARPVESGALDEWIEQAYDWSDWR